MRSRDGDNSLPLRFLFIITFFSLALNAGEYLISYRYVIKNLSLYNDKLNVSRAMQKCAGKEYSSVFLETQNEKNLKKIILNDFDKFIEFINTIGLEVKHKDKTVNFQQTSTTIVTLRTTCFKVDINDNFAKITSLK